MRKLICKGALNSTDIGTEIYDKIREIQYELEATVYEEAFMEFFISVLAEKGGRCKVAVFFNEARFLKGLPLKFGRKVQAKELK